MTRPTPQALMFPRDHDLPPKWDGRPVQWDGWHTLMPAFICPPPKRDCCPACGSLTEPVSNTGRVFADPDLRVPVGMLFAFRCPDCRIDLVLDSHGRDGWVLDESDYSDEGSAAP